MLIFNKIIQTEMRSTSSLTKTTNLQMVMKSKVETSRKVLMMMEKKSRNKPEFKCRYLNVLHFRTRDMTLVWLLIWRKLPRWLKIGSKGRVWAMNLTIQSGKV